MFSGPRIFGGTMSGEVLRQDSIAEMVQGIPPLVQGYLSLKDQLQPNGFDLTLRALSHLATTGSMGRAPDQREISSLQVVEFDTSGWLDLSPGPYLITFNEVVNLPLDMMALGRPRSSLLRSGVSIHTAVWDAGYCGRSQALLVVHHPLGYRVQRGARLMQLVFFRLSGEGEGGYSGRYLGENL
jgi:dUTP pyrophosphatase